MFQKSLSYFKKLNPIAAERTKEILAINPTVIPERIDSTTAKVTVYEFNAQVFTEHLFNSTKSCQRFTNSNTTQWINIEGINKQEVEKICTQFNIHYLVAEDILSIGQRPKTDEINNHLFCLLHMLYFNETTIALETEQISIVLGSHYVISFQEDALRDVFNGLREKMKTASTKLRQSGADYLCYALIDCIVDNYFIVMEKLGDKIELLEEEIIRSPTTKSLAKINQLRKELIVLKRNIAPVRELVNGFIKSESNLLSDNITKYFKDVYDHVIQANDLVENYRDMMITMQDLYINQVNLRMNEVMKVMTIVTCLLAPATVIGGIFGMNFEIIPYLHNRYGFFIAVGLMLLIPVWMIYVFRKRGWF
ncbi:MAG: magnesium/cobalt transporter CorA [Bacteroidetes bacterium]|nr:magnesium/cobalt transporter CorA [Bacteroidota bacterium]MBS1649035.1 magnesium/cobalt transporter CorA [Bacteroidota bacterium]